MSRKYNTCWNCGEELTFEQLYYTPGIMATIRTCPHCKAEYVVHTDTFTYTKEPTPIDRMWLKKEEVLDD